MKIIENLDDEEEGGAKAEFQEIGEMDVSMLVLYYEGQIEKVRIYPDGIERLAKFLNFVIASGKIRK